MHQVRRKVMIQDTFFFEELEQVFFYHFPTYRLKILLGDFIEKVGRKDIFKRTVGNESLRQLSNGNGFRIVNFITPKNLVVKSTTFASRKFISTPAPYLMDRLTTRLIAY